MKNTICAIAKRSAALCLMSIVVCLIATSVAANEKQMSDELRLALLPIPDVLPVYVAEEKGYFRDAGIVVESLTVGSAVERDQLMQAGRIDGMINEVGGAALFNRESVQMQIVSYARTPLGNAPLFRVLVAPATDINDVKQLADIPVAVSKNTVIEYITERLLQTGGVQDESIEFKSVPVLPERLQLLLAGQIKAATLPDPLGFAALKAGAIEVTNDLSAAHLSASVVSFSKKSIIEKKETVRKFMAAWDKAVKDLNSSPEDYRQLMLKKIRVPKNVQQSFQIPLFPEAAVPTETQWDDVQNWLIKKKLLKQKVSYTESVTAQFLAQ